MYKLLDLSCEIEERKIFDMQKIKKDYGYLPFYDDLKKYTKDNNKELTIGLSSFDSYGDITKNEAINYLKNKYKKYLLEVEE